MSSQEQFLQVIDRDEAERRFHAALSLAPLGIESIPIRQSLGRVLAKDVLARVDVPAFDRSNFDGYAVHAVETFGASEREPRTLEILPYSLDAGIEPTLMLQPGQAAPISTGGMLPRGADAVMMVEHSEQLEDKLIIHRAVTPGYGITFAGTDICDGETVLRMGTVLTSRETGVLAAIGERFVSVWRQPHVTVISTGNEIIAPGDPPRAASVYDSNSQVIADAVREQGGQPQFGGIVRDSVDELRRALQDALRTSDVVLLSGGTSKGQGDLCYRVVAELHDPGIVVHGVALKPGKPICLAVTNGKPIVVLPGFPTSAIFTFHEFVAPVLQLLAGRGREQSQTVLAKLATRVNSDIGRTEYVLVGLVKTDVELLAFPMGTGSGSVTSFSRADGFVTIPRYTEIVGAGEQVQVRLIGHELKLADLVVIGSNCLGLDFLLSRMQQMGFTIKLLSVGSTAGLSAAKRGECDLAGIHLLDTTSGAYNTPFLNESVTLITGYGRMQGILHRRDDRRFESQDPQQIADLVVNEPSIVMVNRNQGSGTRIVIDSLLAGAQPTGYAIQPSNHRAVAAAIVQHRADWGIAIEAAARSSQLAFIPLQEERFDFVIPAERRQRPAVTAFVKLLVDDSTRQALRALGLRT